MGNQLAGIAPSQIFPVEYYVADVNEFSYDANLGSTRFFKVARAKHKEGFTVVKVFAIHDPSLPLKTHKDRIEAIRSLLSGVPNCLPFQKAILTDKAALLVRQYVKDNLYDRISTRPFLNSIEKRWIAFQLISAIYECHKLGVCHGDIKLENIMITGWNWVLLTDFASFKPTYLPEDNPADFSYFFDTSRRRTCYIAPERFVKSINSETLPTSANTLILGEVKRGDLMPYMDIFSLGCALTELFTEGHAPFDFSELLTYRIGEYSPWKVLEKIDDIYIRELVHHMMQLEPSNRLSAGEYLEQQRGKAFPKYFYTFLHEYMQGFASTNAISPDEKITKLKKDIKYILKVFACDGTDSPENGKEGSLREGLVIIVSVVTSCLRALKHCCAKLHALRLLQEMVPYLSSEIILDRLLPYMLFLVNDRYPRVRAAAVHTLTHCLMLVKMIPRSDANIFPEYILPNLAHVPQDQSVIVRVAFAENIAVLAETALRFLEMCQLEPGTGDSITDMAETESHHHQASYDTELQALHEMIQQSVSTLLSDPDNIVKQTLLEHGITRLCVFFGRQKANDVLLSHMITFLNDKEDRHLRGSFFDSIVGVGAYVGWQCSPILKPLLQQGLADPEEFVISKTLHAMTDLAELGLLQKQMMYELVSETAPLLCHPNLWIRQGTVGFVCAVAKTLNLADIQCKLVPLVQPFLKQPVIQVQKETVLLNALDEPLPRGLLDYLVRLQVLPTLLESLRERQLLRSIARVGHQPAYVEMDITLKSVYRRLQSEGMTEVIEDKILKMKDHLLKMHRTKGSVPDARSGGASEQDGIIDLAALRIPRHHEDLVQPSLHGENQFSQSQRRNTKKKAGSLESPTINMNEEWQHMFGTGRRSPSSPKLHGLDSQSSSSQVATTPTKSSGTPPLTGGTFQKQSSVSSNESNVRRQASLMAQERNATDYQCVPCQQELQALIHKKRNEYARDEVVRQGSESIGKDSHVPPPKWRPKGVLVAHLHEHQGAVNRLQVIPNTTLFATCSSDGKLKVWDCGRMEGRSIANRSRKTYKIDGQAVTLTVCQNLQSLAVASDVGVIHVVRIEYNSPKINVFQTRTLDPQEDGGVVDMNYFDTGSQSILAYASVYGSIVGWDLRSPGTAWKLDNDPRHGLITTFTVDPHQCWLVAGTSKGRLICWDMRFQLPIANVAHPAEARVRRLLLHQTSPSRVLAAAQWNNEISVWDMETAARLQTLWASSCPPLSVTETSNNAVYSMYMGQSECGSFVLTGGSDRRIRYWDLANPIKSYMVVGAANDPVPSSSFVYKPRLIDGTEVILETQANIGEGFSESIAHSRMPPGGEEHSKYYPEEPPIGHHDCISDLGVLHATQCYIISASQDGVVKVWK